MFRIAQSAVFQTGGVLTPAELLVTQQATPNMSVILGPGRAEIVGTSVSPPSGQAWTTQGNYTAYNDANLTLTIATSNPTNPRIDAVYIQIQDAFYSGSTNTAVAAVATGTPAVSPVAPSIPANSILLAYVAVAANVTTIVTANLTNKGTYPTLVQRNLGWLTQSVSNALYTTADPIFITGYASGTTGGTGVLTTTFPRAFPNLCMGVILMPDQNSNFAAGNLPYIVQSSFGPGQFQSFWPSRASAAVATNYIAYGY